MAARRTKSRSKAKGAARKARLRLEFAAPGDGLRQSLQSAILAGARSVRVHSNSNLDPAELWSDLQEDVTCILAEDSGAGGKPYSPAARQSKADVAYIDYEDDKRLADTLNKYRDIDDVHIIARKSKRHFSRQPVYLIAIPKSGTHFLINLIERLGFGRGTIAKNNPSARNWYALMSSHIHTGCREFFRQPAYGGVNGNWGTYVADQPIVMIYRDPRDILVSEAHWYHKPGAATWSNVFAGKTFEERLHALIDHQLIGSLSDRMMDFAGWLEFPNVIPVSFEELVGDAGGGSEQRKTRAIWSLMLRLQIDGDPLEVGRDLFGQNSPTFRKGQVGAWREVFKKYEIDEHFKSLDQRFMNIFGYNEQDLYSKRCEEFRARVPQYFDNPDITDPILVDSICLQNIVQFRSRYFAISQSLGHVDITKLTDEELGQIVSDTDLEALRARIVVEQYGADSGGVAQQVADLTARLGNLEGGVAASAGSIRDETRSLVAERVELAMEAFRAECTSRIHNSEEKVGGRIDALGSRIEALTSNSRAALADEATRLSGDIGQIRSELREVSDRVQALAAVSDRIKQIDQQLATIRPDLERLERGTSALPAGLDALREADRGLSVRVAHLDRQLGTIHPRLDEFGSVTKALSSSLDALRDADQGVFDRLGHVDQQVATMRSRLDELGTGADALWTNVSALRDADRGAEFDRIDQRLRDLCARLIEKEMTVEQLRTVVTRLRLTVLEYLGETSSAI